MTEAEAKQRFFMLGFIRLLGVASALAGVAIIAKNLVEPANIIGSLLIANGIIDVMVIPPLLIRYWKRQRP